MKPLLKMLFIFTLLGVVVFPVTAQSDTRVIYFEDSDPRALDRVLLQYNVCLEAVLPLNPNLDLQHIEYGTRITIPAYEPCYNHPERSTWWTGDNVQRLKYYEDGLWLARPYYSDEVVYIGVYRGKPGVAEIAAKYNVCVDDLLADNILLQDFETYASILTMTTMDVFIPADAPYCKAKPPVPPDPPPTREIALPPANAVPAMLSFGFNVCPEESPSQHWPLLYGQNRDWLRMSVPADAPPCYNAAGQRLIYYNVTGQRLPAPYYTSLPVYLAAPGEMLPAIALKHGVCLVDLLRINNFPDLPVVNGPIELFIPPARPCPEDIEIRQVDHESNALTQISLELNVCPEDLLPLNPQLTYRDARYYQAADWYLNSQIYRNDAEPRWFLMPAGAGPCYQEFYPAVGVTIYDLERELNVCYQEFIWLKFNTPRHTIPDDRYILNVRHDAPPCYNASGQRLMYPTPDLLDIGMHIDRPATYYSDLLLHIFQPDDTVYSISQQYNVCVHDLLRVNPTLESQRPRGYPTFIPRTRPCYDTATGLPLVYNDENGVRMPFPQVGRWLIYYGSQPLGRISHYYNVCANRIADANPHKIDGTDGYLGWIIPTDRPPCYDAGGNPIHYVCYHQPVDMRIDYRRSGVNPPSFSYEGRDCYDIFAPDTIIWYERQPYKIISYADEDRFASRTFTAWCFGVSLVEINRINEEPAILELLPMHARAIPLPTRECYVQNPDLLTVYPTLHEVQAGETLSQIGRTYDIPWQWIADANDLDAANTIWPGQNLIIPDGFTVRELMLLVVGVTSFIFALAWLYWQSKQSGKATD